MATSSDGATRGGDTAIRAPATGVPMSVVRRFATVEIWERFSFYSMSLLLALFLSAPVANGGFGWSGPDALRFFGLYIAIVQLLPVAGGWIGDRWLSPRRALTLGAWLMLAGHALLAGPHVVPLLLGGPGDDVLAVLVASGAPLGALRAPDALAGTTALAYSLISSSFYAGVALLAIGNGFFKPTFGAVLGRLPYAHHKEREAAFITLYTYVHVGAIAASLGSGWLAQTFGWHWAFGTAAAGMLIAVLLLARLPWDEIASRAPAPAVRTTIGTGDVAAPARPGGWLPQVALLLGVAVAFYVASYQVMGLLNLFADQRTDREVLGFVVPSTWFIALNPALIVTLAPVLAWLALRAPAWNAVPVGRKLAAGFVTTAIAFLFLLGAERQADAVGLANPGWVLACVAFVTLGEILVAPLGAAAVARLAPIGRAGLVLGAWYAANGVGGWLSGQVGAAVVEHGQPVIAAIAVVAAAIALTLWLGRRRLESAGL